MKLARTTWKILLAFCLSWAIFGVIYTYEDVIVTGVVEHGGKLALIIALVVLIVSSHIVAPFGAWPFMLLSFSSFGIYLGTLLYVVALAISTAITYAIFNAATFDRSLIAGNGAKLGRVLSSPKTMSTVGLFAVRVSLFLYPDFLNYYFAALGVPRRKYFASAAMFFVAAYALNAWIAFSLGVTGGVKSGLNWAIILNVLAYGGLFVGIGLVVMASFKRPGSTTS